jgi:putative hydrolase of the HAD superfamily
MVEARAGAAMATEAIRGLLLDLDETVHSREAAFWSWLESEAKHANVALARDRIAELDARGRGDKGRLFEHLNQLFGWGENRDQCMDRFRQGLAAHVSLEPGVGDLLVRLRRSYRLGLVTNGTGATQRAKLASLGIETLFDPIIISEEAGYRKPDPRIFQLAIANWDLPRESILFVGDDLVSDIHGARGAGLRSLRVGDGGIRSILSLEAWLAEQHA